MIVENALKTIISFLRKILFTVLFLVIITMVGCEAKNSNDFIKDIVDNVGEVQYKTISLQDGLEIIYGDKDSDNLYEYKYDNFTNDKIITRRRARNVAFEGTFSYAYADYIFLDNVRVGEEVYNDICIRLNSQYDDINVKKLITGDKVNVICTIMTQKDDCSASSIYSAPYFNKFYVVHPYTRGYDKDYDKCIINYDLKYVDEIYQKYINKEIVYDYDDIYVDMMNVISENPHRFELVFNGIKFKAIVKIDDIYKRYSTIYLGYKVKHKNNVIDFDYSSAKYGINSIYIGDNKYVIDKNELYVSYDEDELAATIDLEKNKFKDWFYAEFQINKFRISFLNTTENNNEIDNVNEDRYDYQNDYGEKTNIKTIGIDNIFIGDLIYFGKKSIIENNSESYKKRVLIDGKYIDVDSLENDVNDDKYNLDNNYIFKVIKIDNDNPNKVLIMLNEPLYLKYSDEKNCTWHNSFMREYLNIDFLNNSFTEDEKNRMYQTCNKDNLYKVTDAKDNQSIDILFPLSKEEVMENHLFIPLDTKGVIRYQEFTSTKINLFTNNKYIKQININSAANLSFSWPVYPCIWINTDKLFSKMENSAYDYKF